MIFRVTAWRYGSRDGYKVGGWTAHRSAGSPDPWTPGRSLAPWTICSGCREGDLLWPMRMMRGGDPAFYGNFIGMMPVSADPANPWAGLTLYRNGREVPLDLSLGIPVFPVATEASDYRLVMDLTSTEDRSISEWTFRSRAGSGVTPAGDHGCLSNRMLG